MVSGKEWSMLTKRQVAAAYAQSLRAIADHVEDNPEAYFGETCAALDARRRAGEVFLAIASNGITRVLKDK